MKGVILAGGTGSRLFPLTKSTNKHLLNVGHEPMIYHAINKLKHAGIIEILIVTGKHHIYSMIEHLGYGEKFGVNLSFEVQENAEGVAQALGLAKEFSGNDSIAVILGDNIFGSSLKEHVISFSQSNDNAMIFLKEVEDPTRYGVASFRENLINSIEEKPDQPKSNCAVTGIYFYNQDVFGMIEKLKPSKRGELEITDVNNEYISRGALTYKVLDDYWIDAGTHESLTEANKLVLNKIRKQLESDQLLVK